MFLQLRTVLHVPPLPHVTEREEQPERGREGEMNKCGQLRTVLHAPLLSPLETIPANIHLVVRRVARRKLDKSFGSWAMSSLKVRTAPLPRQLGYRLMNWSDCSCFVVCGLAGERLRLSLVDWHYLQGVD